MDKERLELIQMVKNSTIFSSLPGEKINHLLPQFKKILLPKGTILFEQGDASDQIFVLLSGAITVYLSTADGNEKIMGVIEPNEALGELGALSGGNRSLSAVAKVDCKLLSLPSENFKVICQQYPMVLYETVQPIIRRSVKTIKLMAGKPAIKKMVFLPIHACIDMHNFQNNFQSCAIKAEGLSLSSAQQIENMKHWLAHHQETGTDLAVIYHALPDLNELYPFIEHNSHFYLVVNASEIEHFDHSTYNLLAQIRTNPANKISLILLHADHIRLPRNTQRWLRKNHFDFHYHVRKTRLDDYQRLYNFVAGTAVGLVLGGGGFKGLAHLGVLKALQERSMTIDMIGGASIGSLVGACYVLGHSYETVKQQFMAMIASGYHATSIRSLTWPMISLFNALAPTEFLQEAFDHIYIEDLWLPYFCVSSNLSTHSLVVHREGLLWERLRASSALPGLTPPMVIQGQLHFDGGLLNNLPADTMRDLIGPNGLIIASQLTDYRFDTAHYEFPPALPLNEAFLARFGLAHKNYRFPDFIDTFLSALLLGSSHKELRDSALADILIHPDLSAFQTLKSICNNEEKVIDLGYAEAIKVLHREL